MPPAPASPISPPNFSHPEPPFPEPSRGSHASGALLVPVPAQRSLLRSTLPHGGFLVILQHSTLFKPLTITRGDCWVLLLHRLPLMLSLCHAAEHSEGRTTFLILASSASSTTRVCHSVVGTGPTGCYI